MEPNKLDFVPRISFLPFEWRNLGAAFGSTSTPTASGRCSFVVRQGVDPIDQTSTGRVVEASGDAGVALHHKTFVLGLSAGNLRFRTGMDDPAATVSQLVGEDSVPSLKITAAKKLGREDNFVAASYDIKQQKPELSLCIAGEAPRQRATLLASLDPVMRALRVSAAVSTEGPEWRKWLYNDITEQVEIPEDDGGRHMLYVQHVAKLRDPLHRTRIGARLDIGRLVNFAGDYFDYHLEERLPSFIWRVPYLGHLYNFLVPREDDEQVRYHIKGWELDVSHEFAPGSRPLLELSKRLGSAGAEAGCSTLSARYDCASGAAGVAYSRPGLVLEARLARADGGGEGQGGGLKGGLQGWKRPSLHLMVEPLTLLL